MLKIARGNGSKFLVDGPAIITIGEARNGRAYVLVEAPATTKIWRDDHDIFKDVEQAIRELIHNQSGGVSQ